MKAPVHEEAFRRAVLHLIKLASTNLSADLMDTIRRPASFGTANAPAGKVLTRLLENIDVARQLIPAGWSPGE